ncbi:MAG: dihydropteroate synthase [Caulobacterales bacterium]|jgi:dihydropteroate synthase
MIMGILNVTPDSFSDGGRFLADDAAIAHGLRLIADGADVLDIGGESTRPGAAPVSASVELQRVLPVIEGLRGAGAVLSIDTMKPEVAEAALGAGAQLWNDVSGFRQADSLEVAGRLKPSVAVMHMQGEPRTMQADPTYTDVVEEVGGFLADTAARLVGLGIKDIWVDPGIGFGKGLEHNLALTRSLAELKARCGCRLLYGASRKSVIGKIDRAATAAQDRLGGSLALALFAAQAGADMLRVHDVRETVQALQVWRSIA